MSKKRIVRGFVGSMAVMAVFGFFSASNVYADNISFESTNLPVAYSSVGGQNETMSSKLVWYFKEENGKKYKRLYDATHQVWLTDWIPC